MRIIIMMLGLACIYWLNIYLQHFQYVLISTVLVFFVELVVGYLEVRFSNSKFSRFFLSSLFPVAFGLSIGVSSKYGVDLIPLAIALVLSVYLARDFQQLLERVGP